MKSSQKQYYFLIFFIVLNIFIWSFYFTVKPNNTMRVHFLNIGQGDAVLIIAPNNNKILIDGGPDTSVLRQLGSVMGFFDRHINIILATHPDKDHIAGLPLVLDRYKVDYFIDSFVDFDTGAYQHLETLAKDKQIKTYYGKRGMLIVLDQKHGVYLHVLYPGPDDFKIKDNNDLSIVTKLVYGQTSFLLTGDAPKLAENMLVSTDGDYLQSDVLKAGHHGSDTSSGKTFLETVSPKYSVISAGLNNRYGHPKAITIKNLESVGSKILKTYEIGNIEFISNGDNVWLRQ